MTDETKKNKANSKGKKLGEFNIHFEFYTYGLIVLPDKNVDNTFAEEIVKAVRSVLFDRFRIDRKLPRLNPFKVRRITRGCTTDVFGIFYDGVWEKSWGVFPTIKETQAFINAYQKVFKLQKKKPELFNIVKGTVRFSL